MQYSFDINGVLMSRRITFPFPDQMSIEAGIVNTAKATMYKSIMKQIEIYNRMNEEGLNEWPVSMLGTPVFNDVTLTAESDSTLSIKLSTALMVIDQKKIIGRTHVTGRNGTVKEFYSMDDYEISIMGSIADENATRYPEDQVKTLIKLAELNESLKISSPFTDMFNVFSAVIHTYKFDQKPGYQNIQFFDLKLYSDTPVELEKVN